MTGLHSVIGILAALHHRDQTGRGQHVETNLLSSALSALVNQTSAYVAGGVVPARMGNAHLSLFPYEPLATGDGELIVVAGNDGQFRRLAAAIGRPGTGRRRAVRHRRQAQRQPGAAAAAAAGGAVGQERAGLVRHPHRGRPAVRADQHRARVVSQLAESLGWIRSCEVGRRASAVRPQSHPAVGDPAGLPLRRRRRWTSTVPSCAAGCGRPAGAPMTEHPTRRSSARSIRPPWAPAAGTASPCSARTWPTT